MTDHNERDRINKVVEAAVERAMEKVQERGSSTGGEVAEALEK